MKKILITMVLMSDLLAARASLIAGWDFSGLVNGSVPETIGATVGSGTLDLSAFLGSDPMERGSSGGTSLNAFSGSEPAPGTALLVQNQSANGKSMVISVSTLGHEDMILTFALRGTGTGFSEHSWTYSTDGINFVPGPMNNSADTSGTFIIRTLDFSSFDVLDNNASVFIRLTLDGASSASGNNRFDNIQLNAAPIPEPSEWGMLFGGGLMGVLCLQTWREKRTRNAADRKAAG